MTRRARERLEELRRLRAQRELTPGEALELAALAREAVLGSRPAVTGQQVIRCPGS